jgi:hypothetical protein
MRRQLKHPGERAAGSETDERQAHSRNLQSRISMRTGQITCPGDMAQSQMFTGIITN